MLDTFCWNLFMLQGSSPKVQQCTQRGRALHFCTGRLVFQLRGRTRCDRTPPQGGGHTGPPKTECDFMF